ncbi:MAG TPA: NAD(P)/FAD-dependent oxidoreductase, partial [Casimicrobiaceae bacterium]|nr:NAD(P)/FAD-dependent oxidoreductase [Casimicrobiaceae bacterium]
RRHFKFRQGRMTALDRARRVIDVEAVLDDEGEEILPRREIPYDMLVIAVGSTTNDFGIDGVTEHAIAIDTPAEAERFHRKLIAASVRADDQKASGGDGRVDVVIIGAGATGVELAAEIRQTTRAHAAYGLEHLDPWRDIRITIIEAAERILPPLPERISVAAAELLTNMHVDIKTGEAVSRVDATGVHTKNGAFAPADLVVWAAGIRAPAWLATLDGLEVNRSNQLVVKQTLETTRDPDVFAMGDCAACPWPEAKREGATVPPRAQAARQQALLLERTVRARLAGKPLPLFRFHDYGSLVSLGEISAVGTLMGGLIGGSMLVQGLIARFMYASLYKLHQRALFGTLPVILDTLGRMLRGGVEPRVKLH